MQRFNPCILPTCGLNLDLMNPFHGLPSNQAGNVTAQAYSYTA